jgi:hypothetical protein
MGWVKHQPNAIMSKPPMATVNCHGNVIFNAKAFRQLVKEALYFELYLDYDGEKLQRIGFTFLNKKTKDTIALRIAKNAKTSVSKQVRAQISPEIACELGIKQEIAKRFVIEYDAEAAIWFINAEQGRVLDTSSYVAGHAKKAGKAKTVKK